MIQPSSGDERAHVAAALVEVEHDVGDALAGPVIGVLAAAADLENGKTIRRDQVLRLGAGAGGVERRMLQQPDQLAGPSRGDFGDARLHGDQRLGIPDEPRAHRPSSRRQRCRDACRETIG
jgi:hypothetical protein